MADVKWIKLNVGMFDGSSFKRIKRAKIGGESFRDKLTAVWFELMDFAGKCNAGGQLIESAEIPFASIDDIAIMIDREAEELNLCMQYYIQNNMITVIDDVYMLTNWAKYQNEDGLNKIREQTRKRVAKHRENQKLLASNATCNVTVTQCNATEEEREEKNKNKKREEREGKEKIDPAEVVDLFNSLCPSLPQVQILSESTKAEIKARLSKYTLADFEQLFTKAEASSFLKGNNQRKWQATFDWLVKEENMAKVLNGNFDNRKDNKRSYDIEAIERMVMNQQNPPPTAADNPELAARVEAMRQKLAKSS